MILSFSNKQVDTMAERMTAVAMPIIASLTTDPALYGYDAPRSIVFEVVSRTARLMVKYLKTYRILIFQLFTATFPA